MSYNDILTGYRHLPVCEYHFTKQSLEYEEELRRQVRLKLKYCSVEAMQALLTEAVTLTRTMFGVRTARDRWRVGVGTDILPIYDDLINK